MLLSRPSETMRARSRYVRAALMCCIASYCSRRWCAERGPLGEAFLPETRQASRLSTCIRQPRHLSMAGTPQGNCPPVRARHRNAGQPEQDWLPLVPLGDGDGSGCLVAGLMETGLRALLADSEEIRCHVESTLDELVLGRLRSLHFSGRKWRTELGLRVKHLVILVSGGASLDYSEMLSGNLRLTETARGLADVTLAAADLASLLTYPKVESAIPLIRGQRLFLDRESVIIDAGRQKILFCGTAAGNRMDFELQAHQDGSSTVVAFEHGRQHAAASRSLTQFLRGFTLDLAGVVMQFAELRIDAGQNSEWTPVLRIRMRVEIQRIPNVLQDEL